MRPIESLALSIALFAALGANAEPALPIGAEAVSITFEDATLSDMARSSITGDLSKVFSFHVPMGELFDFAHPVNGNYAINEIAPSAFNRAILTGLVCNVSANLATSITVRTSLSSEYMTKCSALSAWTNAIVSLDAFLSDLNSRAVTNYPDSDKLKMIALESGTPTLEMVNASMDGIGEITYYRPSILDFVTGFNWAGRTNSLAAQIRTLGQGEAVSAMYSVPVIYEEGAWKFIISE